MFNSRTIHFMTALARVAALAVLGGAILPFLSATPAAAVVVNVGGVDYDVNSITTSASSQPSAFGLPPLGQMPWWGDDALASEFAFKVFNQLGPGWNADYGPVFAYAFDSPLNQMLGLAQSLTDINDQIDVTPANSASSIYAIVSSGGPPPVAVPAPLPLLGSAACWGWSRHFRQRARQAQS